MNIAALVEYDGTRFVGFQRQSPDKGPTIQGALETAIGKVIGAATDIQAAGRTDRGVHATGQVINFVVPERLSLTKWQRALNALLPDDVAIRATCFVADDFHSRKSAQWRSYRYRILCDTWRAPLRERFAWRVPEELDVAAMQAGAQLLLGEHDFGSFGSSPHDRSEDGYRGHTVRIMLAANCQRAQSEPDMVECRFTANAFLAGMVRRLVGTLTLVGLGRLSVAGFQSILESHNKAHPGAAVPPCGLCFTDVGYPRKSLSW
ncbi:MAG: tRNA pseudouridine(38-40) synthase TruA [Ktedonobacterales bacterium]